MPVKRTRRQTKQPSRHTKQSKLVTPREKTNESEYDSEDDIDLHLSKETRKSNIGYPEDNLDEASSQGSTDESVLETAEPPRRHNSHSAHHAKRTAEYEEMYRKDPGWATR